MNLTAAILAAAGILLLIWTVRKISAGTFFLSSLLGIGALFAADLIMGFTHLNLPINYVSLGCAALGGIPGVILLLMLNAMLSPQ